MATDNETGATPTIERTRRKLREGIVTGDKMDKTISVTVTTLVRHPIYGRTVKRTNKFHAHDEIGEAHVGDTVEIIETRPLSKSKRWRLNRIIERAK